MARLAILAHLNDLDEVSYTLACEATEHIRQRVSLCDMLCGSLDRSKPCDKRDAAGRSLCPYETQPEVSSSLMNMNELIDTSIHISSIMKARLKKAIRQYLYRIHKDEVPS